MWLVVGAAEVMAGATRTGGQAAPATACVERGALGAGTSDQHVWLHLPPIKFHTRRSNPP